MKFKRQQAKERLDMGLDMYAYVATKAGQQQEYYEDAHWDDTDKEYVNGRVSKPREIAYWRKHPNLHGWMERLWNKRNGGNQDGNNFNGIELELTYEDLEILELDIISGSLPGTSGFFFGESDDKRAADDLEFIKDARDAINEGYTVFYDSWW